MTKKDIEILKHFEILDDDLLHKSNYFRQHIVLEEKNLVINDYEESRLVNFLSELSLPRNVFLVLQVIIGFNFLMN